MIEAEMGKTVENVHISKQKLLGEIEHLSNPYDDPILRAFGLLDVPLFSEAIDDALYGAV